MKRAWTMVALLVLVGCDGDGAEDAGPRLEDAGPVGMDAGPGLDAGRVDAGGAATDAGASDAGAESDAGIDGGVPAGSWSAPASLESLTDSVERIFVATDDSGNASVLLSQTEAGVLSVYESRYAVSAGVFTTAAPIETSPTFAEAGGVTMRANGDALALVLSRGSAGTDVTPNATARGAGASSWGALAPLGAATAADPRSTTLGAARGGNAAAVWPNAGALWAARYTPAGGWLAAEELLAAGTGTPSAPRLVVSDAGAVFAYWSELRASLELRVARFDPTGGSWSGSTRLDNGDAAFAVRASMALRPDGSAVVVWEEGALAPASGIWASVYDPSGGTWSAPMGIRTRVASEVGRTPALTVDSSGEAVVAWRDGELVRVSRLPMGSSAWSTPVDAVTTLTRSGGTDFWRLELGVDDDANLILGLLAESTSSGMELYAVRYDAMSATWEAPETVSAPAEEINEWGLAVSENGMATLAWIAENAGTGDAFAARLE